MSTRKKGGNSIDPLFTIPPAGGCLDERHHNNNNFIMEYIICQLQRKESVMKRIILAVLIVALVTAPCFAQEVEPDGLFSIGGTKWQALPIGLQIFPFPWIEPNDDLQFAFYGGEVYPDLQPVEKSFYMDMPIFSIFGTGYSMSNNPGPVTTSSYFGILQPIGIGTVIVSVYQCCPLPLPRISIALLIKTGDTWVPPGDEGRF
jgi:hypothetical protein